VGNDRNHTLKTKLLFLLFFSVTFIFGSQKYISQIQKTAKNYRVEIKSNQINNVVSKDGSVSLNLELTSNRNNFEMVMLVGFASAGQAISHQNSLGLSNAYVPKEIAIRVNVPASKGETMVFEANCSSDDAMQLAAGTLDSSEFMQKIDLQTS